MRSSSGAVRLGPPSEPHHPMSPAPTNTSSPTIGGGGRWSGADGTAELHARSGINALARKIRRLMKLGVRGESGHSSFYGVSEDSRNFRFWSATGVRLRLRPGRGDGDG